MPEVLDIVNGKNEVVGDAPLDDIYSLKLNHRIIHVMIFNDKGELFLQKRSIKKSFCPGHWVTSAGGHVQRGESSSNAAKRQLYEELGVSAELKTILDLCYDSRGMKKFLTVFSAVHKGPFKLCAEEVTGGRFFPVNDVKQMVKKNELIHPELGFIIGHMYP